MLDLTDFDKYAWITCFLDGFSKVGVYMNTVMGW